MSKLYFSLLVKEDGGKWHPQFGSYKASEVQFEHKEYRRTYFLKNLKIICTDDDQKSIQAFIDRLNKEEEVRDGA